MTEKQKTCLGITDTEGTCFGFYMKHLTQYPKSMGHVDFENMFPAVPKSEHNIMKQHLRTYTFKAERYEKLYREKLIENNKLKADFGKLGFAYNELVQYSAKQCTDLVNSISKKKYDVLKCNFKLLNETNATLLIANDKLKEMLDYTDKSHTTLEKEYGKLEKRSIPKEKVREDIQEVKDEMLKEEGMTYISGWEDACDKIGKKLLGED